MEDSLEPFQKGNGESLGSTHLSSSLGQCWLIGTEIGLVLEVGTLAPLHFGATHSLALGLTSLVVAASFGGPWALFTNSAFCDGCLGTWLQWFPWRSPKVSWNEQPVAIRLRSRDREEDILGASQSLPCGTESQWDCLTTQDSRNFQRNFMWFQKMPLQQNVYIFHCTPALQEPRLLANPFAQRFEVHVTNR